MTLIKPTGSDALTQCLLSDQLARSFESFQVGQVFTLGPIAVDPGEAMEFAQVFDPQPMHLDPVAGDRSLLSGLSISGWQTCALWMRMFHDGILAGSTSQGGPGMDSIRWLKPVRPGDDLTGRSTVTATRTSRSRPDIGLVSFSHEVFNQHGEMVAKLEHAVMFRKAEAPS